jgi:hypothetical protein
LTDTPLLHIGYQKTGTTWFQDLVFNDPSFGFIAPLGSKDMINLVVAPHELDYDHEETRLYFDRAMETARSQALVPVFSQERFSGHPHSGSYDSKLIALRLRKLLDDAHVLIVLREQSAMILSSYNQYIRREGAISLTSYVAVRDRWRIPLFDPDQFKYHRLIQLYFDLFGREKVLVLPYEVFVAEPVKFTEQILTHAGITDIETKIARMDFNKRVNTSLSPLEVEIYRRANLLFGRRSPVNQHSLLPSMSRHMRLFYKAVKAVDRVLPQSYDRRIKRSWQHTVRKLTGNTYRESNRLTSELIELDLSKWGYDM